MHSPCYHNRLKNNAISRVTLLCNISIIAALLYLVEQNNSFICHKFNILFKFSSSSSLFFFVFFGGLIYMQTLEIQKKSGNCFMQQFISSFFQCWIGRISHLTEKKQNKHLLTLYLSLSLSLSLFLCPQIRCSYT